MNYQQQEIVIETTENYGGRPPVDFCGLVFRGFSPMFGYSVRMALEGSSSSVGAPPLWLRKATDVRITGFSEESGATVLNLEAPMLGEAAQELYAQDTLWETKPSPKETAVNVLARVLQDVGNANVESILYDRPLLGRVSRLKRLFGDRVTAIRLPAAKGDGRMPTVVNEQLVESASRLSDRTPPTAHIRLTGKLDMIRHSTRSFGLLLEDGEEVRGVLETQDQMEELKRLLGSNLLVVGKAVYRPSGKLLRIDAQGFEPGNGQPRLFAKVPPPREKQPNILRTKITEYHRKGIAAFFGTWPGDETDQDFERMLKEVRG